MDILFSKKILVLDKNYQPIRIINLKGAIYLVFRGAAAVIDKEYNIYELNKWLEYSKEMLTEDKDFKALRSVDSAFGVPDVVILKEFKQRQVRKSYCTKKNVNFRDLFTCQYCSEELTYALSTIDHVVPVSKGGGHTWDNLVTCCRNCNNKKGDKDLDKTGFTLLNKPKPLFWDRGYFRKYESRYPNEIWRKFL
jgi:hypothetical protein